MANSIPPFEVGFLACRASNGRLVRGPLAAGTATSVNIPVSCPGGALPEVLYHTHPPLSGGGGGLAVPSQMDLKAALDHQIPRLCITGASATKCYEVRKR